MRAGDLVDRVGHLALEARLELAERPLDHVDVDGDVRGPQRPGADPQALADRGDRVVGLGDDADDLGVVLLELADVDDAVGDEDPAPLNIVGCALIAATPVPVAPAERSVHGGCDTYRGPAALAPQRAVASGDARSSRDSVPPTSPSAPPSTTPCSRRSAAVG